MTGTARATRGTTATRRPSAVRWAIGLLVFLGLSAMTGGIELTFGIWKGAAMPAVWLHRIPIIGASLNSWLVPGLILGLGFGIGSLVTAYGLYSRRWVGFGLVERWTGRHWSWLATLIIGVGMVVWIGLEILYIPQKAWLQLVYGPLGLVIALLAGTNSVRRYTRVRTGDKHTSEYV